MLTSGRQGLFLQKVLFCVVVEGGFLRPAEGEEGLADGCFDVGGDGAAATVVVVVAAAGEEGDEVVLDIACLAAGNVVVHLADSERHADGLVGTELWAVFALHLWVPEVDDSHDRVIFWDIVFQDGAQAMFAPGAALALADSTFCYKSSEKVISCHLCFAIIEPHKYQSRFI